MDRHEISTGPMLAGFRLQYYVLNPGGQCHHRKVIVRQLDGSGCPELSLRFTLAMMGAQRQEASDAGLLFQNVWQPIRAESTRHP
jgi:hypothetical protein